MSSQEKPEWVKEIKENWKSNEDSQRIANWFKGTFSNWFKGTFSKSKASDFSAAGRMAISAAGRVQIAGWIAIVGSVIFYLAALSQDAGVEGFAIGFVGVIQGFVLITFGAYVQARVASDKENNDLLRKLVESSAQ
jgi:hypothetical protein